MWKNISIRYKILLPFIILIAVFITYITTVVLPSVRSSMIKQKQHEMRSVIASSFATINYFYGQYRSGKMPEDEAKAAALNALSLIRYGSDARDYVFITTVQGDGRADP